jgi:hypothetical protein
MPLSTPQLAIHPLYLRKAGNDPVPETGNRQGRVIHDCDLSLQLLVAFQKFKDDGNEMV